MTSGPSEQWTALVAAGQRPGPDALADAFGVAAKALVPVAGEAMLSRVARTLLATPEIARVVVLAQRPETLVHGDCAWLANEPRVSFSAGGDRISTAVEQAAGAAGAPWPVLVTTADHPLLTPEIVSTFLAGATDCDLAVGMVERSVLLARYPANKRTWLELRDGAWSGANLFALRNEKVRGALRFWARAEQDRKSAVRLFLRFGPWLAFRLLTRSIGLADGLRRAGRRLGLEARLVALPFAEAAIDVDKLSDHEQVERILEQAQPTGLRGARENPSRKAR